MVNIGLFGAGHLGKIHLKLIKELSTRYNFIGFYDANLELAANVEAEFGIKSYHNPDELLDLCDAVDVVTPTLTHYQIASAAIKKSKHVFIEKPLTSNLEEAKSLQKLAHEAKVKVQVGHVERFNPAFTAAKPYLQQPMFIETHRLAQFNPRGTDVSVVLDLMIHDIDIVLSIVKSSVKKISASGVAVVSDTPDITNARIEFDNGCVANLTASRISLKNMRKTRLFQRDAYISIDFLDKEVNVVKLNKVEGEEDPFGVIIDLGENKGKKQIYFEKPEIPSSNAIKKELEEFADAIQNDLTPTVSINDGFNALDIAFKIIDKLKLSSNMLES
jgi:predicted dehydrogenase